MHQIAVRRFARSLVVGLTLVIGAAVTNCAAGDAAVLNLRMPDLVIVQPETDEQRTVSVTVVNLGLEALPVKLSLEHTVTGPPGLLDTDGDGWVDVLETILGSNPGDATSTPEASQVEGSCFDGVDNDGNGLADAFEPGCAAALGGTAVAAPPAAGVLSAAVSAALAKQSTALPKIIAVQTDSAIKLDSLVKTCKDRGLQLQPITGASKKIILDQATAATKRDVYVFFGHSIHLKDTGEVIGLQGAPEGGLLGFGSKVEQFVIGEFIDALTQDNDPPAVVTFLSCKCTDFLPQMADKIKVVVTLDANAKPNTAALGGTTFLTKLVQGATFGEAKAEADAVMAKEPLPTGEDKAPEIAWGGTEASGIENKTLSQITGTPSPSNRWWRLREPAQLGAIAAERRPKTECAAVPIGFIAEWDGSVGFLEARVTPTFDILFRITISLLAIPPGSTVTINHTVHYTAVCPGVYQERVRATVLGIDGATLFDEASQDVVIIVEPLR